MKLFNSEFEVSMRVLLLLDTFNSSLDLDQIMYLDFFTIFSKNYGLEGENINGDSDYRINSLTMQPDLYKNAIRELVTSGLIVVRSEQDGFRYRINESGRKLCKSMTSDYSIQYKNNATLTRMRLIDTSIENIKTFAKQKEGK
ncbi:MAG: hypothetical protein BWY97_01476 [Tenericutes bacterium ADurb.BinA124]|nr:MAG: hypothetical protein BWY97_01476 [Tenericutes bacterium ADurb.BinA124]